MTFPSASGTRQDSCAEAWTRARGVASAIKTRAISLKNACVQGPVSSSLILDFATAMADAKLVLTRVASTGGIAAYAQAQINDNTINIATEFNTMSGAVDAVITWVIANFPKDGNGFLLAMQFAGDNTGRTTDRTFTSIQTAGLQTALDSLISTID